jgi:hypothetical protein
MRSSPSRYIRREELSAIIETVLNPLWGSAFRRARKLESALGKFTPMLVRPFS